MPGSRSSSAFRVKSSTRPKDPDPIRGRTTHVSVLLPKNAGLIRDSLGHVTWQSRATGEQIRFATEHLFVMIGADPCTTWLRDCVDLDSHGFVRTSSGSEDRGPFETSVRGIFAVGDVRSGSVKRVASAVGEGSVVVPAIHRYLGIL